MQYFDNKKLFFMAVSLFNYCPHIHSIYTRDEKKNGPLFLAGFCNIMMPFSQRRSHFEHSRQIQENNIFSSSIDKLFESWQNKKK